MAILLLINGCKEEEPKVEEIPGSLEAADILNKNAGFDSVYNYVKNFAKFEIGAMQDMTLEANGNLNMVLYTTQPSQQQPIFSKIRLTKNINTNQIVPLPAKASVDFSLHPGVTYNSNQFQSFAKFRPYTNYFVSAEGYATTTAGNKSIGYTISGDYVGSVPKAYDVTGVGGVPNMTYTFPTFSNGVYGRGIFGIGLLNPDYKFTVMNFYNYEHTFETNLKYVHLEGRFAKGASRVFELKSDSFKVYSYDIDIAERKLIFGEKTDATDATYLLLQTNYSLDGNTIGFLFTDDKTKSCWSYSYNLTTNTLTQVVKNQTLDYSGTNSDIDVDELGNIYYSGTANNGANAAGISIYKKSATGTTVVGSDNFLRTGEVVGLRYLLGKVYLAVFTGSGADAQKRQVTIIKEK